MATMTNVTADERLVKYLTDAHSIEEQALTQMRAAPKIAGDERLAEAFREHLAETERHEQLVRERLEAHGASPSTAKDLAGKAGGYGMVLFAKVQPDTPGKLVAHGFSYEHMETAAYEMLKEAADAAGDEQTARVAEEICGEERRMADRLASCFDAAADASLGGAEGEELDGKLDTYLKDAHALEEQAVQLLASGPKLVDDDELAAGFEQHLHETEAHEQRIAARLEARGSKPSTLKDMALKGGAMNLGGFFGVQPDTTAKLAGFAFAFEHLEIAGYELLKRVAARAGDSETVALAEGILADEEAAAEKVATSWHRAVRKEMSEAGSTRT
jgi:ferritin-like metal-binding protein YciE